MDDFGDSLDLLENFNPDTWTQWLISITTYGGVEYKCGFYVHADPI